MGVRVVASRPPAHARVGHIVIQRAWSRAARARDFRAASPLFLAPLRRHPAGCGEHAGCDGSVATDPQGGDVAAGAYRWVVLFFGVLTYATSHFARQNYAGIQQFIAADFALDRAAFGLMGSVFFYAYALSQLPWGISADKFGGRGVAALGILLTAAAMAGFATSRSETELLLWRALAGVAGAAAYVAIAGAVARWFPVSERGLSQGMLGGVGGALGESAAFFLLPVLSVYFAAGWRQATFAMALAIGVIGVLCVSFLRSAPPRTQATIAKPLTWDMLTQPVLWCYAALFCAQVIGIRTSQAWIAIYYTDVYITAYGYSVGTAAVAGGFLAMTTYSLLGRGLCVPLAGMVSDTLRTRGVPLLVQVIGWLGVAILSFQVLSLRITTVWLLGVVAVALGTAVNSFPLITASITETYGPQKTASVFAFLNTMAQIAGATVLALSGYAGVALSGRQANSLAEYQGIWLSSMTAVAVATAIGVGLYFAGRHRPVKSPAVLPST